MKTLVFLLLALVFSGCGYTANSSIDNSTGTKKHYSYRVDYCDSAGKHSVSILRPDSEMDFPSEIVVEGEIFKRCGEGKREVLMEYTGSVL